MIVRVQTLRLYLPWVHSLKEKRMVVRSLVTRLRDRLNLSVIEAGQQDTRQTIVIGMAVLAATAVLADQILDQALSLVEGSTEAEVVAVERETR